MKYFNQMEVMPIYSVNLMVWGMAVGMASLDEIRFYSLQSIVGIGLAVCMCAAGSAFLLQKSNQREK